MSDSCKHDWMPTPWGAACVNTDCEAIMDHAEIREALNNYQRLKDAFPAEDARIKRLEAIVDEVTIGGGLTSEEANEWAARFAEMDDDGLAPNLQIYFRAVAAALSEEA